MIRKKLEKKADVFAEGLIKTCLYITTVALLSWGAFSLKSFYDKECYSSSEYIYDSFKTIPKYDSYNFDFSWSDSSRIKKDSLEGSLSF